MKARVTTKEHRQYEESLNSPSSDVSEQLNKVPKLIQTSHLPPEEEKNIQQLFAYKTLIASTDDELCFGDTLETIGFRLQDALAEEYVKVDIGLKSIARATARLLDKESEYQADLGLLGDHCLTKWTRLHHENIYLLACYIQLYEIHAHEESDCY